MKKVILLLLCAFGAYGVNAAERSLQEMRQIAASVLSSKVSQAKGLDKATRLQIEPLTQNDMLTVMGSKQAGFVVISNDVSNRVHRRKEAGPLSFSISSR